MLTTSAQLSKIRDIITKFKISSISNKSEQYMVFECLELLLNRVSDLEKEVKKLKNAK